MASKNVKRALLTATSILVVLLALVGTIAIIKAINDSKSSNSQVVSPENTSSTSTDTNNTDTTTEPSISPDDTTASGDDNAINVNPESPTTPTIDPSKVGSLDIPPMSITVSYVKGIKGFEYEVLRTPSGTRYVEFRNTDLIGTKCTDDEGTFASILESPKADESSTLKQKITVDGTEYGLSLAASDCTSDPDLLMRYQQSFTDAFSLLKKM